MKLSIADDELQILAFYSNEIEAFMSLWEPRGNIAIPYSDAYGNVDLQVKSLLYVLKKNGHSPSIEQIN